MRLTFAAIVLLGLPAVAVAQSPVPGPGAFPALAPIGLPLPPIGLPLPPIGLSPVTDTQSLNRGVQPAPGPEHQPPRVGSPRKPGAEPVVVFYVPTYGWGYPEPAQTAAATASVPAASSIDRKHERPTGRMRLDVQPNGVLQVFVDDYYVGTPDDFNGELELEAGPHTIELRADLYQTLTFDAKIAPGRSITYRGALTPTRVESDPDPAVGREPVIPNAAPQTVAPATPTTIYFIPGCYLGNVPPENVALPANCDLSRLITRKPESR